MPNACWTGLKDDTTENRWYNVDGSPRDYLLNSNGSPKTGERPWYNGQPNDWGSGQDCVHIWETSGWYLNDCPCNGGYMPICRRIGI